MWTSVDSGTLGNVRQQFGGFGLQTFGGISLQPSANLRRVFGAIIGVTVAAATSLVAAPAQADVSTLTSVSGTVTLDGAPTAGLTVCAGASLFQSDGYHDYYGCTVTAVDGSYTASFDFPGSSDMASAWVDPGTEYQDVFPVTSYGETRAGVGYFHLEQGNNLTGIDIAVKAFPVVDEPVVDTVGQPTITGSLRVGKKLTAVVDLSSVDGATVSYQWYRNGAKIARATKQTYRLVKKDRAKRISVEVTVEVPDQDPITVTSAPTAKVHR